MVAEKTPVARTTVASAGSVTRCSAGGGAWSSPGSSAWLIAAGGHALAGEFDAEYSTAGSESEAAATLIALKAGLMNLLSVGAAYGVVALAAEGGWFGQLLGIDTATPVAPFIPVMMFAILFGLSMDYEVFVLSRVREQYLAHGRTHDAVADGLARTARVITAAAAIMVCVFLAFVVADEGVEPARTATTEMDA